MPQTGPIYLDLPYVGTFQDAGGTELFIERAARLADPPALRVLAGAAVRPKDVLSREMNALPGDGTWMLSYQAFLGARAIGG